MEVSLAIQQACVNGDLPTLKQLVTPENVNMIFTYSYKTLVYCCCKNGHLECIRWLIDVCGSIFSDVDLASVCYYGHEECVKYFLHKGANVNALLLPYKFVFWYQSVFEAAISYPSILKLLLEAKSYDRYSSVEGRSYALSAAVSICNTNLKKIDQSIYLLMQHGTRIDKGKKYFTTSRVHTLFLYTYEEELDDKHRACIRAARTLTLVLLRWRFPRDIRKKLVNELVLPSWLDDAWRLKRTRKQRVK